MLEPLLDRESTYKLDTTNVYASVEALADQLQHSLQLAAGMSLPAEYKKINKVVIAGMGGSALGGRVIKALGGLIKLPFEVSTDFNLPEFTDAQTLVILSSYSGNTEETLSAAGQIQELGGLPIVIATGGKLAEVARKKNWPALIFEPHYNPSNQPRMALGYSLGLCLAILHETKVIEIAKDEFSLIRQVLDSHLPRLGKKVPTAQNSAKQLAGNLHERVAVLIAGQHLVGAAHAFKNQLNENAKTFSCLFDLPELNHHLLEGMGRPKNFSSHAHVILFDSLLYSKPIQDRIRLTEEVMQKQGYGTTRVRAEATKSLAQAFETIQFGSFVSLYLAMLNKIDPGPIPWVDYFKKELR